ncbi:MAG: hypothetical protein JNM94_04355 [Phycisphaerae bacterium]|nr:hypothetical protein [Phycisphaerae bacterium]
MGEAVEHFAGRLVSAFVERDWEDGLLTLVVQFLVREDYSLRAGWPPRSLLCGILTRDVDPRVVRDNDPLGAIVSLLPKGVAPGRDYLVRVSGDDEIRAVVSIERFNPTSRQRFLRTHISPILAGQSAHLERLVLHAEMCTRALAMPTEDRSNFVHSVRMATVATASNLRVAANVVERMTRIRGSALRGQQKRIDDIVLAAAESSRAVADLDRRLAKAIEPETRRQRTQASIGNRDESYSIPLLVQARPVGVRFQSDGPASPTRLILHLMVVERFLRGTIAPDNVEFLYVGFPANVDLESLDLARPTAAFESLLPFGMRFGEDYLLRLRESNQGATLTSAALMSKAAREAFIRRNVELILRMRRHGISHAAARTREFGLQVRSWTAAIERATENLRRGGDRAPLESLRAAKAEIAKRVIRTLRQCRDAADVDARALVAIRTIVRPPERAEISAILRKVPGIRARCDELLARLDAFVAAMSSEHGA